MSKVKVELNSKGIISLLQSDEVQNLVNSYGDLALNRLGGGYETNSRKGKTRVNCEVVAVTRKAINDNSQNNTILKAVRG